MKNSDNEPDNKVEIREAYDGNPKCSQCGKPMSWDNADEDWVCYECLLKHG